MRKIILGGLLAFPAVALAGASVSPPSTTLTTGPVSLATSIQSVSYNPAAGYLSINQEAGERFRFGYMSSLGFGIEYGDVASFQDEVDELIETLDEDISTLQEAIDTVDRFNAILPSMGEDGYIKFAGTITYPGFPVLIHSKKLKGTFSFDLATDIQVYGGLLDDDLAFVTDASSNLSYQTNTAAYLKAAQVNRFGFGYSRPIWKTVSNTNQANVLFGAKLNAYQMSLTKQVQALDNLGGEDLADVMEDDYNNNQVKTTRIGIDLGIIWQAKRYALGVSLLNINEPEFEYGTVGQNCASLSGIDQSNCFVTAFHIGEGTINATEVHKMSAVPKFEGSFNVFDNWAISSSIELEAYDDFVGTAQQWFTLSTSYVPNNRWVPYWRAGYRNNLTGTRIKSITGGLSLFGVANFDIDYGLNTTTVDGDEVPRRIAMSLGFEERF